jgi:hypothetical protein
LLENLDGTIGDGSGPLYDYMPGADCSWLIAPEDSVNNISLEFLQFETEAGDELIVYDGPDISSPVLGSYQGSSIPSSLTSSGDKLLLRFTSSGEAPGFLISYEGETPVYCNGATTMTEQSGTLTDGSGPRDYHNGTMCMWMITPPNASEITLFFNAFHTEQDNDLVQVYDLTTNTELAVFSGNIIPDPVTCPSGKMYVAFSTNGSITAPGWDAYYVTDLVSIGEAALTENLQIFPNPADKYVNVSWFANQSGYIDVTIYDLTGKAMISTKIAMNEGNNYHKIDVQHLPAGIFLVKFTSAETLIQRKLIISHQ